MCCLETTVYFSPVIDRPRVSVSIASGLCDDWIKIKSSSFITDEQMHSHCVLVKTRQTWLPFEFITFLYHGRRLSSNDWPYHYLSDPHFETHYSFNELRYNCICTEILVLLTMKLELLSPLLPDSPFLSSKVFLFFRFSNLTVEWTKWKMHKNFRQKPRPRPAYCGLFF